MKRLILLAIMYGKHFESMYTGSMVGIGAIPFAVWGYVISHQRPPRFEVELNPIILATIIGEEAGDIEKAIAMFCEPDLKSRTEEMQGRKLERLGPFLFRVVNGARYDAIRSNEERKAYWREQKQKARDAEKDENPKAEVKPPADKSPPTISPAMQIYDAYPRKLARGDALKAIEKALKKMEFAKLLAVTQAYAAAMQGEDFKFVPYPASWFNAEHYFDDPAMWKCKPADNNGAASVFEIKTVLEAKEKAIQTLKNQHATETALGMEWDSDESMLAHKQLRIEVKQLAAKLAAKL